MHSGDTYGKKGLFVDTHQLVWSLHYGRVKKVYFAILTIKQN